MGLEKGMMTWAKDFKMTTNSEFIEIGANLASMLTAVVASCAYCSYLHQRKQKRDRLENYLKRVKEKGTDQGQRTVMHLISKLGMTETEIIDAAFQSSHIVRKVMTDEDGIASKLLLEYSRKRSKWHY